MTSYGTLLQPLLDALSRYETSVDAASDSICSTTSRVHRFRTQPIFASINKMACQVSSAVISTDRQSKCGEGGGEKRGVVSNSGTGPCRARHRVGSEAKQMDSEIHTLSKKIERSSGDQIILSPVLAAVRRPAKCTLALVPGAQK